MDIVVQPGESFQQFVDEKNKAYQDINLNDCINFINFEDFEDFVLFLNSKVRLNGNIHIKCLDQVLLAKHILNGRLDTKQTSNIIANRRCVIDRSSMVKTFKANGFAMTFTNLEYIYYVMKFRRIQ